MLTQFIKSMGIPLEIRNFMVDYVDKKGESFHKPLQTVIPIGTTPETDVEIIRSIKSSLSQQGFVVSGIMEAVGEFEMEQLSEIFNDPSQFGKTVHPLYLDPEIVLKTL